VRLFIAVDPDEAVKAAAGAAARELAGRLRGAARAVRWVDPTNLHLTVRFIGDVDPPAAARVREQLEPPIAIDAFELAFGGVGAFPAAGPPRVVWIGVTRGAAGLAGLHDELERRVRAAGLPPDDRPFAAHLTIGRVKRADSATGAAIRRELSGCRIDVAASQVTAVTLYRSRTLPSGPVYEALSRTPLTTSS
jgi:2'-5' RNA ligase